MKKQFEEPQIEVVELQEQDVICTSGFDTEPYDKGDFSWS